MKYMGSKRWMLGNGLGTKLKIELKGAKRFFDLFSGSGSVAGYVAEHSRVPVFAYDLQEFSAVLSRAVIGRKRALDGKKLWKKWRKRATRWVTLIRPTVVETVSKRTVRRARNWSRRQSKYPFVRAYGGHYYSPRQAAWIQALRATAPNREPHKSVALAALIEGASRCAAAPGHTAQPFQVTRTAKKYLKVSWSLDVAQQVRDALIALCARHAKRAGQAFVGDANVIAKKLKKGDLAFVDPPYSGVHYSRFYHVLEGIAQGKIGRVSGVGRYPARKARPRSAYSVKSESYKAIGELLNAIADKGARAIVTFPNSEASNGLSGAKIRRMANERFWLDHNTVEGRFSTLGGNGRLSRTGNKRKARQLSKEMILVLRPRAAHRGRTVQ